MKPYREIRGYPEDFIVSYRLFSPDEGGRKITFQHLRCDFLYDGDDPLEDGIYMIHPEFLDSNGQPLPDDVPVPLEGTASMWILNPEMRTQIHQSRVAIGIRGFFVEGSRKIGEVRIERIVGLHSIDR